MVKYNNTRKKTNAFFAEQHSSVDHTNHGISKAIDKSNSSGLPAGGQEKQNDDCILR